MPNNLAPRTVIQNVSGDNNVVIAGNENTVNQTIVQKISNFFTGDTEAQRAYRNRQAMLELVRNNWIKGVLEKSLYNEVIIDLKIEEHPEAVERPWDMQVQMPNQANQTLPTGTPMINIFDEMSGAMLILGEPGSGKTTILLELARDSIAYAEQDPTQPIPVVFNLSSWTNTRQTIDDWLVNELNAKYNAPKKLAQSWVKNNDLDRKSVV
jgi:eukaryotic-like serine/threonine-protein kinase